MDREATQSGHPDDVLTLLLRHQQALDMDDAGLLREVAFFYLASAHTSVHSIVHAFHEIHSWAEQSGRSVKALVNDQALLQQCVHESLRLHPSSPESWRRALAPHRLSDGTEIEAVIRSSLSLKLRIGTRMCLDRMPMFSIPCALVHLAVIPQDCRSV